MPGPSRFRSRRAWLLGALRAVIGVTVAAVLYPVVRYLQPRSASGARAMETLAPYRVSDLRALEAKGEGPPPFNFGGEPCLVILTPEGEVRAFNAVCTHLQCTVEYRPDLREIFCPCHNGVYDLYGHNVAGPPPAPLKQYKVTLRESAGQEEILISRSV